MDKVGAYARTYWATLRQVVLWQKESWSQQIAMAVGPEKGVAPTERRSKGVKIGPKATIGAQPEDPVDDSVQRSGCAFGPP